VKAVSVSEALALIERAARPLAPERIPIGEACGRVLAEPVVAAVDQPPFRSSAMDGYAVRFADASPGAQLRLVGEAAAGSPFAGRVGEGEAVRIFTGGVVPEGADHVVIQEETERGAQTVTIAAAQKAPSNVRAAGVDFRAGAIVKPRGARLSAIDLALIASANVADLAVARRPRLGFFDNGDELVEPGRPLSPGKIVGSLRFALEALIGEFGAEPLYLGRAPDRRVAIAEKFSEPRLDAVIAVGGASVGDHDHMRGAFADCGGALLFEKVSVKPGKPTWFGRIGERLVLGLPGNPASATVCAMLFARPLIAKMCGAPSRPIFVTARLDGEIDAAGARESYLRAAAFGDADGALIAAPFVDQDSSLLSPLAKGNALIRRLAGAPAARRGELVDCLLYAALGAVDPDAGSR
jgi:molybdopterin molybdotransferase